MNSYFLNRCAWCEILPAILTKPGVFFFWRTLLEDFCIAPPFVRLDTALYLLVTNTIVSTVDLVRWLKVVSVFTWFVPLGGIRYVSLADDPVNSSVKKKNTHRELSFLMCLAGLDYRLGMQQLHKSSVIFCLQILFFTVQSRNQPHDPTDIYHAIHCRLPCLYIPGTSVQPHFTQGLPCQ